MIQIQQEHQKAFPDTSALDEDTIAMIHRLAAFLQNHCDQHLTLETLGKIFYTNKNKLSYLFRLVYRESIPDYIQKMRLEKAQKQLEHPGISIYEIAHSIGSKIKEVFQIGLEKKQDFRHPNIATRPTGGIDKMKDRNTSKHLCLCFGLLPMLNIYQFIFYNFLRLRFQRVH